MQQQEFGTNRQGDRGLYTTTYSSGATRMKDTEEFLHPTLTRRLTLEINGAVINNLMNGLALICNCKLGRVLA